MKRLILTCLLIFTTMSAFSGEWILDNNTNCQVWNSNPSPGESIRWSGTCLNGKATGKGILQWYKNGKPRGRYEGEYRNGRKNGNGKYIWTNGNIYEGDWVDGKRTGTGKYKWKDGDVYIGDFIDGKRTGKGEYTWNDGDVYEGDWVNGKRTGKGKIIWKGGWLNKKRYWKWYEGQFVDGKRTGFGVHSYLCNCSWSCDPMSFS